jgi:hypothetical protein
MIIVGGLGSVLDTIFGAIFVTVLPIILRLVMEPLGGSCLRCGRAFEHHNQLQAHPVRLPYHLLFGNGAAGPERAVAQHPQLAIFVLSMCRQETEGGSENVE